MRPIRAILHPTDFSEHAEMALAMARALARDHGARLILLHVCAIDEGGRTPEEKRSQLTICRDALEEAKGWTEGDDLEAPIETELRTGRAAEQILGVAAEHGCDLIVMGTRGRSGLGRVLLGSVAEAVLRQARCPVLTVKLPEGKP